MLGVMKKYGCELNTPRNDEITLFVFTLVLINQFHLFLVFSRYEWVTRCACVKNTLGEILKQSSKLVKMAVLELKTRLFRSSQAYLTTPSTLAEEKNWATCETGYI